MEPLPGTRAWSRSLGVSAMSLKAALRMLQRDGLLVIQPRKSIRLVPGWSRTPRGRPPRRPPPVVRLIYYGRDYLESSFIEPPSLAARLQNHGIGFSLERCTHARLKAIGSSALPSNELLFLSSLPAAYHRYFALKRGQALVCGHPAPGSPLSYITVDEESAVHHATQSLLRRHFSRLSLLIDKGTPPGVSQIIAMFQRTCAAWPHQPVHAETLRFELALDAMRGAARRFAARARGRQGVIVCEPVSATMVMTALMERGIVIHRDVEIIALDTPPNSIKVCPGLTDYPFPVKACVKRFTEAALHFFETGALPRLEVKLPIEAVPFTP